MSKTNLSAYMAMTISQLREERRMGTAHVYQSTLNRIKDFMERDSISFEEVTPVWLKAFQEYLLGRQLHWNTISTYMRMLRATYFRAVDEGMAPYQPRLFKGVYTGTKVTVKRAVDEDVFRRLDTPVADESLEPTRLLFLLLFMLRGMPFVDIAYLRHCDLHDNVIVYRRKKTGAWLTVRVEAKAMEIIRILKNADGASPYLFPLIHHPGKDEYRQYQNALRGFNYRLKKIGEYINGITGLTSYTARHSWATIANYRNYQQELISNAMGHSSVKVTETYFKRHSDDKIWDMNKEIVSYIFSKQ